MAIQSVQAFLNGTWYTLTYNSSTSKYEATLTAPGTTSWNLDDHVYPMQIKAKNTAGTEKVVGITDPTVGNSLKLRVLEKVKPTINITSPGAGAYVTNNKQPIVFQLRDESGGSGIDLTTLALKIDSGTAQGSSSSGMACTCSRSRWLRHYTPCLTNYYPALCRCLFLRLAWLSRYPIRLIRRVAGRQSVACY